MTGALRIERRAAQRPALAGSADNNQLALTHQVAEALSFCDSFSTNFLVAGRLVLGGGKAKDVDTVTFLHTRWAITRRCS